jgi:hypothetical protein
MISKRLFLGLIIGGFTGFLICFGIGFAGIIAAAITGGSSGNEDAATAVAGGAFLIIMVGWLCALVSGIAQFVIWYKAWASIQDGQARTSPGKAIAFLFIPFFNLYWMFQAIYGFAVDYNKYIVRHQKQVPPLPEGLYLTILILPFFCIIPILGLLIALALLVMHVIVAAKTIDAVNAIAQPSSAMSAHA